MKPRYVTEEEVDRVVSARPLTDALEQAFRALATGQARQAPRLRVTSPPHVLHNLPAIGLGRAGLKTYLSGPQGVTMVTVVFELESGRLEALIECNRLSQLRTGCATALATRYLAEPGPQRLALLGAGTVARGQLEALAAEQELAEVRVFSPRPQSRDDFVGWARERLSLEARGCASPSEALEGANLVVTATSSGKPLVEEAMLAPKCHLNAVGANRAGRRELASEVVLSSQLTVVDDLEQARIEAGDLLEVAGLDWGLLVPLASLVANPPARRPDRTLFKSLGVALEDLAAAVYVLQLLEA